MLNICGETTSQDRDSKIREALDSKAKASTKEVKDSVKETKAKDGIITRGKVSIREIKDLTKDNNKARDGTTKEQDLTKEIKVLIKTKAKVGIIITTEVQAVRDSGEILETREVKDSGEIKEIREAKALTREVVIKVGVGKVAKVSTKLMEIKGGEARGKAKARDGTIRVKDSTRDRDSIKVKDKGSTRETKDGTTKIKVSTKAADNTGIITRGSNKIRAGDQEGTSLCPTGKINTTASSLPSNSQWDAKNAEVLVLG